MGSNPLPDWAGKPCIMGIDEAGRGPVLGPMVYGCLYCSASYQETLATLKFAGFAKVRVCLHLAKHSILPRKRLHKFICSLKSLCKLIKREDSKTLKEEKREELFESLKADASLGWAVDIIDPRELSAKMLQRIKINLNTISHDAAMGLVSQVLARGVLLSEVYVDTVGDADKYRIKLEEKFRGIKFVVSKKADSLYPIVSGASIVAKVTRDNALRSWVLDETAEGISRNFGSGYPGDPATKAWLEENKHPVFGFPTLVRFSWATCNSYTGKGVTVVWEPDEEDIDKKSNEGDNKKQQTLNFPSLKRKSEELESSGKGRFKFFSARKLQQVNGCL